MAASLIRNSAAALLLSLSLSVAAIELLPDPTRPAIAVFSTSATGEAAAPASTVEKAGLQSVVISPQHRAAVIDGVMVELGGKIGDATLVEVRENSVVLQGGQGKRVLELFSGVRLNKSGAPDSSVMNKNAHERVKK
jgi:MSHA biogenesis protein MshK